MQEATNQANEPANEDHTPPTIALVQHAFTVSLRDAQFLPEEASTAAAGNRVPISRYFRYHFPGETATVCAISLKLEQDHCEQLV